MNKGTLYFPEIFDIIGKAKTEEERIELIRKYSTTKGMAIILVLCYDPKIKWVVTREEIEHLKYDHMDIPDYDLAPTNLFKESRSLRNYTNLRFPPLKKNKVIRNITMRFSAMHHNEIELFKQIVDGHIIDSGLSAEIIYEAWPGLLSGAPVKSVDEPNKPPESEHSDYTAVDTAVDTAVEGENNKTVSQKIKDMAEANIEKAPAVEVIVSDQTTTTKKSMKGMKFYNNGTETKRFADNEVPEGFVKGRLKKKGKK